MTMNHIAIGIDQSMKATGLCIVRFDREGRWKVIRAVTVETPTYNAMRDAIVHFPGLHTPTVIMCEDGFKGCNVATTVTAAWVEAIVCQYKLGEMFDKVVANKWRSVAWPGKGKMKAPAWKAHSIEYAKWEGIVDPDDHQGDALGLAIYGIKAYLEADDGSESTR